MYTWKKGIFKTGFFCVFVFHYVAHCCSSMHVMLKKRNEEYDDEFFFSQYFKMKCY